MNDYTAPKSPAQAEKIVHRRQKGWSRLEPVTFEQLEAELAALGISGYDPRQVTEPPP